MEDDDEFGDLYTDVFRSFTSSSSSAALPPQQSSPAPQSTHRPIDLNNIHNDEEDTPYRAPNSNQTLASSAATDRVVNNSEDGGEIGDDIAAGSTVSESADAKLGDKALEDVKHAGGRSDIDSVRTQQSVRVEDMVEKEVNFDIEEAVNVIDDVGSELLIPGLSSDVPIGDSGRDGDEDDWDRDSEDDLQIVLNDNDHGPMAIKRGGMAGGGDDVDDDEDEDALVIVADGDPNQPIQVQDWGEDAAQSADGERKEMSEAGKSGASMVAPSKIGYSSHGYHPFHSQFKYVRPGAVPMPEAATSGPGGGPGQVRPLINMGPMAGRGRGEWRPTGLKNAAQFHSGFGMPVWGAGRGFGGGLEFTLPSHKTIFEVDIESFENKPWKYPGIDASDFFNFGFNEESWKCYCKQLEQLRLESTMQSKIRVYESARTEKEYDPDLPPELAAATGNHDVPAENTNPRKMDAVQSDLLKEPTSLRTPLPTGRAIQVEGGYGERLPSIDTRPARIRDSDAIIEIIPQGSLDDDTSAGNDASDRSDNDSPREDSQGGSLARGVEKMDSEYSDSIPQAYRGQKRESDGTQASLPIYVRNEIPDKNVILPEPPEASGLSAGSMEQSRESESNFVSTFEERQTHGRVSEMSPPVTPSQNTRDKRCLDDRPKDLVESMDSKCSPVLSSPVCESSFEQRDTDHDEIVLADGSSGMENVGTASNRMNAKENGDAKKKKLTSRVEQPIAREPDEGEDSKATRSSDNSRARSVSSKDYRRLHDGVEEEVMQGRSPHMKGIKRYLDVKEQGFQRKYHDGRPELERSRGLMKGRDDSYVYRESDSSSVPHLNIKPDGLERRKERRNADEMWQHRGDDSYSRRIRYEESRKRERGDEMESRHRGKVQETDRIDTGELYSRKQLDNGNYRVYHDKDVGRQDRERDYNFKGRYEHMGDYHSKRRKSEEYLRRDHRSKEEIFHGPRENTSRWKQERDEVLDQGKRGEQQRFRVNLDDHSVGHKDGDWLQRERIERHREREKWQRLKQSNEENIFKREREEGRSSGARAGRGAEDKAWFGQGRTKDENKGSVHHGEPLKRRGRANEESCHHGGGEDICAHGKQGSNEERKLRHESSSTRNGRAVNISDEQKVREKKHKDNNKRNKGSEGGSISVPAKRNEDHNIQSNETGLKGYIVQSIGEQEDPRHNHSSRRQREEASDDEQQDLRRGRSKLERWTSNEKRDFSIKSKSLPARKFKEIDQNNSESLESSKPLGELPKPLENGDTLQSLAGEKDAADLEIKDDETKPLDDKHQDTIEKLKKRSERFKPLLVPSEKDAVTTKNLEPEPLPFANDETPVDSEIKPERPARKRRWISN